MKILKETVIGRPKEVSGMKALPSAGRRENPIKKETLTPFSTKRTKSDLDKIFYS